MSSRLFLPHAEVIPFGCQPLETVLTQQLTFVDQVSQNPDKAFILWGEHTPVYTVGRGLKATVQDTLLDIPIVGLSRGGQMTYHGPGQLVIYPIVSIRRVGGVPALLQQLERWIGSALDDLGLPTVYPPPCGTPDRPATGVWLRNLEDEPAKVASIGLAIKQWVSYHGIALNVCNPLMPFYAINPCGFSATVMTSVHHTWMDRHPGVLPPTWDQLITALGLD